MAILPVVEHNSTNINQIAIGNFVVRRGDLGAIGGKNTVGIKIQREIFAGFKGFYGNSNGKKEAIAPGLIFFDQLLLLVLGLDQ